MVEKDRADCVFLERFETLDMRRQYPFRAVSAPAPRAAARFVLLVMLSACAFTGTEAQSRGGHAPAAPHAIPQRQHGEHLSQWMQRRSDLTPEQQQRALQQEPGFRQLPPETQQRMMDRLQKLNQMPADQRERMLQRNETIERMNPEQRHNFQNAMQSWGAMPADRRRVLSHNFNQLRQLPPDQRAAALNSQPYRSTMTDQERSMMSTILSAEPVPAQNTASQPHP